MDQYTVTDAVHSGVDVKYSFDFMSEGVKTNLAAKSVSVRMLAELAGHSSIQTTQRYIDVNPQQMSAAVELL